MANENLATNLTTEGGEARYNYVDEIYNIRLNDPEEGPIISPKVIVELSIDENLFSLLPTFKLVIEDKGTYFSGLNIKNGDRLYITITPNIENKGDEPKPYIKGEFCIQSINCLPDLAACTYNYTILGIFNAQTYLNQVTTYPKTTPTSVLQRDEMSSDEIIHQVLDDTPLKFLNHCEPNDKSLWINCNDTRAQFIEKVVEHAWIAVDDAPILYTDIFGQTHYTSIKTISTQNPLATFENIKYFYNKKTTEGENIILLFGDCDFLNAAGPILNQGGYKIKQGYYSPYNMKALLDEDIPPVETDYSTQLTDMLAAKIDPIDIINAQMADFKTYGKYRNTEYLQNTPYLANRSNKAASQLNTTTKFIDCGMNFKDFHNHYDLAPKHNEMIRRSFFQNFINMLVDVHRQPIEFRNNKCRPVLGDKIYADFSTQEGIDKIHSGNYIVCGLTHCFRFGHSYTIQMKAVTDGTFGKGVLE